MPSPADPTKMWPRRRPARPALAATIALSGYTNIAISRAVGIHPDTVGRIVLGTVNPTAALRQRIADALSIDDVEGLFALAPNVQRLVDEAGAAGIDASDVATADRLVAVLARASNTRRRSA